MDYDLEQFAFLNYIADGTEFTGDYEMPYNAGMPFDTGSPYYVDMPYYATPGIEE